VGLAAGRVHLPAAAQGGHRRGLCLALDLGRPGKDARTRPGPQVRAAMSHTPDERLHRLLGGDALAALRQRLRWHFERADPAAPSGIIRLSGVSPPEYEALAALLGRPPRYAHSVQIDIATIDAAMSRAGIVPSLKAALARLDGPIPHLPTPPAPRRWRAGPGWLAERSISASHNCCRRPAD
jgi:Protein of unknown function N-terminus (DUF3323)